MKEFKKFIMTGNVIDLAVAVIIAGAIGLVITGFVNDIMMPIVGHFAGGIDFADMKYVLDPAVGIPGTDNYEPENAIRYGMWINSIINLIIVGLVLFGIVKAYNKVRTPEAPKAPAGPTQEELLTEIRNILKEKA